MEGGFIGRCDCAVDEICNAAGHRQAEKQRLGAVQQALVVHHPAEALLRHAHRFQHGKLPAAQADIRGDRIEHIGRGNQGDQHDKAVGKYPDNGHNIPVCLGVCGVVEELPAAETVFRQHGRQIFKARGVIARGKEILCIAELIQRRLGNHALQHAVRIDHIDGYRCAAADKERSLLNGFFGPQRVLCKGFLIGQLDDVVLVVSVLIEDDLIAVLIDPAVFSVISVDLYIVKTLDHAPIALERVQRDILLKPAVKLNIAIQGNAQGVVPVIVIRFLQVVLFQ